MISKTVKEPKISVVTCWHDTFDMTRWLIWLHVQVCCAYTGMADEVNIEADSDDITEHRHDDKPRPYLCTVCDKQFTRKSDLNKHSQIHNGEKLYLCILCEKHFQTRDVLRLHMNLHSGKHKCTECGKCFDSKHNLTVHKRSHSGEKPFECFVCSKRFVKLTDLVRHNRTHSGEKPHECPTCGKAFSQSGTLNVHMRVHTGNKPYKCSLCDESFGRCDRLLVHTRHVHGNSSYECSYCGKLFKTNAELKRHVYTHTGQKPYSCGHCSDTFTQSSRIKEHLLKLHAQWRYLVILGIIFTSLWRCQDTFLLWLSCRRFCTAIEWHSFCWKKSGAFQRLHIEFLVPFSDPFPQYFTRSLTKKFYITVTLILNNGNSRTLSTVPTDIKLQDFQVPIWFLRILEVLERGKNFQ